jgi:OFA family oxalate/formate antiporter-like MFS transporter
MATDNNPKGWPALVGGGLINIALGTYYAWSVFVPALEKEFHWTRTQTSIVPTIDMVSLASMFVVAGFLQNKIGPRAVGVIGGLLYSLGLYLASFTDSLTMLYLTWGVMVGTGIGFGYLIPISVGSKWFPHHRGLVNGLAIGIFAAGSGVFGPIGGTLIEHIGWRSTFQVFAGVFFVFTMVGAAMMKNPPEGYAGAGGAAAKARAKAVAPDVTTSGVLKLPKFYALWFAYALGTTAGTMVISQLVPFARGSGYDANAAKFALTIGAIGSATGRFLSGWMSDHLGRLPTLRAVILISMIATPTLYVFRQELVVFYVLLFFVYYCYGTQLSVYTALAGDFWGTKYLSTNYGLLLLAWGFAGVMGPQFGARIFDATHSYQYAFFGASGLAFAAILILFSVRTPAVVATPAGAPAMAGR